MLCVSLVLAVLTAFAVPPDWAYLSYPDYRTLALLFCLMLIVAGFRSLGVFQRLGGWLLRRAGGYLYLYSVADMGFAQFAWAVLPYTGISLVLLAAALLFQKDEPVREFASQAPGEKLPLPPLLAMLFCLALCLLVVFRVVGYLPVLVCVALVTLLVDRRLYGAVDYALLLTFLCFFIFVGNIKRLPEVNSLLQSLVGGRELWAGILASQVISNVPAAILLSGFTGSYGVLLTAVNLGGLGTPIASLASLISFKFCAREYPGQMGRFFRIFTVWNLLFLAVLTGVAVLLT